MAHPTTVSATSPLQGLESFILDLEAQIEAKGAEVYRLQAELAGAKADFKRSTKKMVQDWEEKFRKAGLAGFNVEDGETDSGDDLEIGEGAPVEIGNASNGAAGAEKDEGRKKRKKHRRKKHKHAIVDWSNGETGPVNGAADEEAHSETARLSELFWARGTKDDGVEGIERMLGNIETLLGDWSVLSEDQLGNLKRGTKLLETGLLKNKDDETKMAKYFDSLAALEEKIREFKNLFGYDEQTFKACCCARELERKPRLC